MRKTEAAHSSPTRAIDRFSRPGKLPRSFPPCEGLYLRDARLPASPLRGEERRKPASPARQAPVLPFGPQKAREKIEKKAESPSPFPAPEEPGTASGSAPGRTERPFPFHAPHFGHRRNTMPAVRRTRSGPLLPEPLRIAPLADHPSKSRHERGFVLLVSYAVPLCVRPQHAHLDRSPVDEPVDHRGDVALGPEVGGMFAEKRTEIFGRVRK